MVVRMVGFANVENGQCMPGLCECVLKMVNENAMVKLLIKMPRLCECRKWSMLMFIFKKSYKFVASYVTFVTVCYAFVTDNRVVIIPCGDG